jgi:hypothetical protein
LVRARRSHSRGVSIITGQGIMETLLLLNEAHAAYELPTVLIPSEKVPPVRLKRDPGGLAA